MNQENINKALLAAEDAAESYATLGGSAPAVPYRAIAYAAHESWPDTYYVAVEFDWGDDNESVEVFQADKQTDGSYRAEWDSDLFPNSFTMEYIPENDEDWHPVVRGWIVAD